METNHSILKIFDNFSNNILFIDENEKSHLYKDVISDSISVYLYLKKIGLKKGDKIIIQSDSILSTFHIFLASFIGNFIICPIDNKSSETEFEMIKNFINPKIIIKEKLENYIKIDHNITLEDIEIEYDKDYLMILTSGTTGIPKGIIFNNTSILASANYFSKLIDYDENSRVYHILPIHYMAGVLNTFFAAILAGSSIVLGKVFQPSNIYNFWKKALNNKVNTMHLTPTIALTLIKLDRSDNETKRYLNDFREIVSTGSMLHDSVVESFEKKFKIKLKSCYGITEAGGPLTLQKWEDTFLPSNVGSFLENIIDLKVTKEDITDKHGLLYIKNSFMMEGYLGNNGREEIELDFEGYFNSGDYAEIKNGVVYILGRKKEIIKKAGELISLNKIENVMLKLSYINEVSVIGLTDEFLGERIIAFVIYKDFNKIDKLIKETRDELRKILKNVENPDKIIPIPYIPKNQSGKILKQKIKDIYII